ncbi:hypothetical protein F5051DRAFT_423114 [Lentinula edodes]|nr:hypothetical protein F5051DRAFT_423114 [Lentinula edodes]
MMHWLFASTKRFCSTLFMSILFICIEFIRTSCIDPSERLLRCYLQVLCAWPPSSIHKNDADICVFYPSLPSPLVGPLFQRNPILWSYLCLSRS